MSQSFTSDRCIPWLFSQAGVRVEHDPEPVAPAVAAVRARLPRRAAFRLKFAGVAALFAAAIAFMSGARPAAAQGSASAASALRPAAGIALGGLGVGAFAVGRRLDRGAPALTVLCAARGAELDEAQLAALVAGARKRMADQSWPDGHVWLISEAPLGPDRKVGAAALDVRCFAPIQGRITEV